MARDFDDLIKYIDYSNPNTRPDFLGTLPDICPICTYSISPEYILIYFKGSWTTHLLCGCPRNECGALFFAEYQESGNQFYFQGCYPNSKTNKEFPQEVAELSPNFVAIFNQAHHAEQEKLDLVCGVAYRKALEYLIKDYVLSMYPEDDSKIKSMPLQQCIQKFITEPSIKLMAERATWLGNDETHYIRKWVDKDLQDLKNLIDLTVFFISMSLKASKYKEEMVR
ncbi:hypothetical protein [Robertmurraya korlensis]|uniref:hypothetical protein n=1 Tax=Robertmurraya korlensis TaxID=519977 RepID=UPI000AD1D698|nr:hypothetical protein [Robertmurraya korlensis]